MMGAFMKSDTPRSQREREQAWVEKYERYETEKELARARRQAIWRWLRMVLMGPQQMMAEQAAAKEAAVCTCIANGRSVCCGGRTLIAS